ncbi:MAG: alpha-2-macroglobulin family protein, partial [Bacteroidota bacterium]
YGPRALSVSTTESRAQIVQARSFGEKGEVEGGGGGADLGGIETRGNFKYTAYWNPGLRTDSAGNLIVRFKLPDNLTTFKIMAVAQSKKSEFGYTENSFTVSKPLLLQAALPRFARLGDSFEAGVIVHNYSDSSGQVQMFATTKGIRIKGKEVHEYTLSPGESKEVRFPVEVKEIGKATFTFKAKMRNETDGLTVSIPLQVPRRKETVAQLDAVPASLESKLIVPTNTYEELGSIEFTASSTALTGLGNSVDYLFSYPYGCIEQKSSKLLPIILGREMVEAFGFEVLKGKDPKSVVASALREFRSYQAYSGGFSYWSGDDHDSPYASAFVMYVLAQAKRNGYTVDENMMRKGVEYIKGVLRYQDNMPNYPYSYNAWAGTKTLILYTLALLKQPEPAYYELYYRNLDRIPLFAKANLLKAIQGSTKNKRMSQAITTNLLNNIKVNPTSAHFEEPNVRGLEWCWNSNVRTTAIILQTLLETNSFPGNKADYPAKIVKWLMQQQKSGRWQNTQENVYVVDALATYFKKYEREEPKFKAEIVVAGQMILSKMFEGRSLKIEKRVKDFQKFEKGKELALRSKKDGQGMLYAGVRTMYYPKDEAKVRDEGIAVIKTMEPLNSSQVQSSKLKVNSFTPGTIVKVTLRVITPQQRNFVVVDDPLPAGLEAVNTSLQTESSELSRALAAIQSEENRYRWWGSFNHHELRDDRVLLFADELEAGVHTFSYLARATTFGKFEMPATYAEMMYEPEVFGQTGSVV